jgi:hypothetical protein
MNVPSTFCTRAFGHRGLDVMDGAERAMSHWPNKGEPDVITEHP